MSTQRRGLHDWWAENQFMTTNAVAYPFIGTVIASGTNTTAVPLSFGYLPHGVFLRSSTTANGGYRYQTGVFVDFFGSQTRKFRGKFAWRTSFATVTTRIGFHDTITSADAVDGAYFAVVGGVASAKTANNSVRTTAATTLTLALNVAYTFDIDVNAAGTSARYRIYEGTLETPVLDQTITTNIPVGIARAFGAGIVCTESTTTASDMMIVYYMGYGSRMPDETLQETVFVLTGTTPALDTYNGTIQTWTLTANSTLTDALASGQSIVLLVDDGTAFTVTWPAITWVNGVPPVLATSGMTIITLFKVGSTLYGNF